MQLTTLDIVIIVVYAIGLFALAQWVSRSHGQRKNSTDYFLASKYLPCWAIGASLIAANISAEQIVGMSGSGYAIGLAIASYEWMAAATLLIVGKWFLPIFLANRIYTMPQFLEQRYGARVVCSLLAPAAAPTNRIQTAGIGFRTSAGFNLGAVGVIVILIALYTARW
jgi:SSS family solute:Na+ symporter